MSGTRLQPISYTTVAIGSVETEVKNQKTEDIKEEFTEVIVKMYRNVLV